MSDFNPLNPLIVQGDHTILIEVDNPLYLETRNRLLRFAELVKSPEHIHTYRLTPLSIWNACASGVEVNEITDTLTSYSKYKVPTHVLIEINEFASRYGRLKIIKQGLDLLLVTDDRALSMEISLNRQVTPFLGKKLPDGSFAVHRDNRGRLKQALIKIGYPAEDLAGYTAGESLSFSLRHETLEGLPFTLRPYQTESVNLFHAGGADKGGSGVIVLPCGAGKTIIGTAIMDKVQTSTLILATNVTAVRQWISELLDKTTLTEDQIGEYSGRKKEIKPVTVSTYQIMTYRKSREDEFKHMELFDERDWGLIIYDEVHMLPAPVFQATAGLQAKRRLGLTATLVREDGLEEDVFALIGPKKADIPWKELEHDGWIAKAICTEILVPMPEDLRMHYAVSNARTQFRIASENPDKLPVIKKLIAQFPEEQILVIGMYVSQVKSVGEALGVPVLTGATTQKKRDQLFGDFRAGKIRILAVSKVANFSVDLPDAGVAIQISGTFGSRQEEAQRLGRILRPKKGLNQAHFFSLVSHDTKEQEFAMKRQLFLCEQGYEYKIGYSSEIL